MTKKDIIIKMAKTLDMSKSTCEKVIDCFIDESKKCLLNGDKVSVKGFLVLDIVDHDSRMGRDPRTGKVVEYPPYKSVKCRLSKAFKDIVKGKQ